ncbi:MAG: ATP-binding protein [Ezakiella sp.]|nr:ATP-binding protein [Ezakiella sp.]MDD7472336.1 ATP-binding protein [Bacillota bacterium]MDY3923073.1 ATP-binding protein [Ezakiella sp.]
MKLDYSGSVNTDIDRIKEFNKNLVSVISEYISDEDTIFDVKLILDELTINSALHGNRLDPSKLITVQMKIGDSKLKIVVADQGNGVLADMPIRKNNKEFVGGRGLSIVDALVDELEAGFNQIICVKYL